MAKFKKSYRKKPNKKRSFSSEQKRAYYLGFGMAMGTIPPDDNSYNIFGYYPVKIETEKGTLDGVRDEHEYYYMVKKIYSRRFATDGFSGFYFNKTIKSKYGLKDMPCYENIHATSAELEQQNSYFVSDLTRISGAEEEE